MNQESTLGHRHRHGNWAMAFAEPDTGRAHAVSDANH